MDKITLHRAYADALEREESLKRALAAEQNTGSGWGTTLMFLLIIGAGIFGTYIYTGGTL